MISEISLAVEAYQKKPIPVYLSQNQLDVIYDVDGSSQEFSVDTHGFTSVSTILSILTQNRSVTILNNWRENVILIILIGVHLGKPGHYIYERKVEVIENHLRPTEQSAYLSS